MDYTFLCKQLAELTGGVRHPIANLANAAALLWQELENINRNPKCKVGYVLFPLFSV